MSFLLLTMSCLLASLASPDASIGSQGIDKVQAL